MCRWEKMSVVCRNWGRSRVTCLCILSEWTEVVSRHIHGSREVERTRFGVGGKPFRKYR